MCTRVNASLAPGGVYRLERGSVFMCIVCDVTSENRCILPCAGSSYGL